MPWNPFAEIALGPCTSVEIFEGDDAVLVRITLDGVRPEDVVIDADERLLAIHAKSFMNAFQLPVTVDGRGAIAVMSDGVLTVRIPRRGARANDTFAA